MIAAEANSPPHPLALSTKVQPRHHDRLAIIYIRQSTPQQVLEHRESTALQYALRDRAVALGWGPDRLLVIDEDLGQSGSSAEARAGFQRVLAEVTLGHAGLILGIEMSRLARSCRDWHQLLEVCALFDVILADTDGVYDPRDYNDRLLLGLKGTISEAELHLLRQRMNQGRLNKARRGELFSHPPLGYVREGGGRLGLDPDQQVQAVVRLVFGTFDQLGSLNATLRYLVKNQVFLPIRSIRRADVGRLQWSRPSRQTLRNLLHNPIYAGVYTWGRRAVDPRRKIPGRRSTGRTVVPPEQCQVFLPGRCPAYITWEQYQANQKRLADNRCRAEARRPVREGPALLSGLLVCGLCGQRLNVQYGGHSSYLRYACTRNYSSYAAPLCQGICGRTLDGLIETLVLRVLEPATLNREGWHPPKRRATFNADMVRQIFYRRGLARTRPASSYELRPGEWWFTDLARELQLPHPTLYSWMCRGWVNARKIEVDQGRWVLFADGEELDRLRRLRSCPRTWANQPQAAELRKPKPWPPGL